MSELVTETIRNYYDNGQLMWEISYLNGKKHGTWKKYYENGQLE